MLRFSSRFVYMASLQVSSCFLSNQNRMIEISNETWVPNAQISLKWLQKSKCVCKQKHFACVFSGFKPASQCSGPAWVLLRFLLWLTSVTFLAKGFLPVFRILSWSGKLVSFPCILKSSVLGLLPSCLAILLIAGGCREGAVDTQRPCICS